MAKLSPRAARVVEAAFGERWQSPLARAAGVPEPAGDDRWAKKREPTDDVYRKCAKALIGQADRVRGTAERLDSLAGRMLPELDGE
jgi:hypothetical protein